MSNTAFLPEKKLRLIFLKSFGEKFWEETFSAIEKINFYGNYFATSVRLLSFKSFARSSSISLSLYVWGDNKFKISWLQSIGQHAKKLLCNEFDWNEIIILWIMDCTNIVNMCLISINASLSISIKVTVVRFYKMVCSNECKHPNHQPTPSKKLGVSQHQK